MRKIILVAIFILVTSSVCIAGEIRKDAWRTDLYGNPVYEDDEGNTYKRNSLRTDLYSNPIYQDEEGNTYKRSSFRTDLNGNPVYVNEDEE